MMPNIIILDTYQAVREFREMAANLGEHPDFADDVLQTLIEFLHEKKTAMQKLQEFVTAIKTQTDYYEINEWGIEPVYGDAVHELGMKLFDALDRAGAYDATGVLPYQYHLPHVPYSNNDVMVSRIHALPSYHEHTQHSTPLIEYAAPRKLPYVR